MATKKCTWCKNEKRLDEFHDHPTYSDGKFPYCKKCNQDQANVAQRTYCTIERPNGLIEDWILWTNRHALEKDGGLVRDHWKQTMPEEGWPSRKELLLGVLAKSNGKPTLRTCYKCGDTKPVSEYASLAGGTGSRPCKDCRVHRVSDALKARATRRLWPSDSKAVWPNAHLWRALDKDTQKAELAKEREIKAAEEVEPNKQDTSPPDPKRPTKKRPTKVRPVPRARWGQSTQRDKLYIEATRNMLRMNKWAERETCELTGWGPFNSTQFCHTFHVKDCKKLKKYDWIGDNNNGFLLWEALNPPMDRGYHWKMVGDRAFYVPPEGEDYYWWMVELDIPNKWIVPTPEQVKYILMAQDRAWGIMY